MPSISTSTSRTEGETLYSPETRARIETIRAILPTLVGPDRTPERLALMKEVVALIREGRVSASISSANAKARKAKATVVDGDALLADLEP